jgi:hypothetical protein
MVGADLSPTTAGYATSGGSVNQLDGSTAHTGAQASAKTAVQSDAARLMEWVLPMALSSAMRVAEII